MFKRQKQPETQKKQKRKLTAAEKREIRRIMEQVRGDGKPHSAQDTLPFRQMYPDGLCKLDDTTWSRCIEFADVNYQLAQPDDQTAIFEALCDMYNAHDSSIGMEITLPCRHMNREDFVKRIEIAAQGDDFDDLRELYTQMLRRQLEQGKQRSGEIQAPDPHSGGERHSQRQSQILPHCAGYPEPFQNHGCFGKGTGWPGVAGTAARHPPPGWGTILL